MKDIYVGRQPILNIDQKTVAYELLYRSGKINAFTEGIDGLLASSQLISNVFGDMGLQEIAGGLPVFINFNREMLLSDLPDLNPASVVIEILEGTEVDRTVLDACARLRKQGFRLALDDFVLDRNTRQLLRMASIVKIDWRADTLERIQEVCSFLHPFGLKLLAEKVETEEEFLQARELGFSLFQGFFFERPTLIITGTVKVLSGSLLEIIGLLQDADIDFEEIEKVVSRDAALALKLLKIINSASVATARKIDSIKQALVLLGQQELKRWLTLLILTKMSDRCPAELLSTAFIRGLFAEKMAMTADRKNEAASAFIIGLFSLLDAMLKRPMGQAINGLPLTEEIMEALMYEKGDFGPYITLMKAYEQANKKKIKEYARRIDIEPHQVVRCYISSLRESGAYLQCAA